MARIVALITDLFQDSEFLQPETAFRKAGHQVEHIGLKKGNIAKGFMAQTSVLIDRDVQTTNAVSYDALFIPGGYSPDRLRENEDAIRLVREFMNSEKPVFIVCHGLQLLISACMLAGRRVAGRRSLAQDVANAGGTLTESKVVVDGNLISSCGEADMAGFINACLQKLSLTGLHGKR